MFQKACAVLVGFLRARGGNVAIMTALSLPVVLGAFGVGAEAASWMAGKRAMQNAADAAAIAAASNAGPSYDVEALAVAAQYGFQNGVGGVTVSAINDAPCPAGATGPCYRVNISRAEPLLLAQITGYQGDTVYGGSPAKLVGATAVAVQGLAPRSYCVLTLATSGATPALRTNGAPDASLSGCNVMSNSGADCNGHNLSADNGDAHGNNSGCGVAQHSNMAALADPYASLASNIPPDPCGGVYPQEPTKKSGTALTGNNHPSGSVGWSGTVTVCGDVQLASDVTLTQNTTLVIYNGDLDTNGFTLQSAAGVGATVVFAGDNSYSHVPTGGGTLDMAAPTSGPWSGMVLYQAPSLTSGVDISAAGNSPTWNLTGVAYFPHSSVTFSGAVGKASNGKSCFSMTVDNLRINGTGAILAHGQCPQAGVNLPTAMVPSRGKLVS